MNQCRRKSWTFTPEVKWNDPSEVYYLAYMGSWPVNKSTFLYSPLLDAQFVMPKAPENHSGVPCLKCYWPHLNPAFSGSNLDAHKGALKHFGYIQE